MVRAKFVVDRVVREVKAPSETETQTVVMRPVRGQGQIQLPITPEAADQFVLGHVYSVDFSRDS